MVAVAAAVAAVVVVVVGGIEIVPVGAAWMVTKATCRVSLTDLRDFLAVSLGTFWRSGLLRAPFDCDYELTDH